MKCGGSVNALNSDLFVFMTQALLDMVLVITFRCIHIGQGRRPSGGGEGGGGR